MLRGIFFDLDDTLIGYGGAERIALEAGCAIAAARNPAIEKDRFAMSIYRAYQTRFGYGTPGFSKLATLTVPELRQTLTSDALEAMGIEPEPRFVAQLNAAYEAVENAVLQPFADTLQTLDRLSAHFPLGIITNGPSAMQRTKLATLELTERFRVIIIDTEFGHPKPDPRIFEYAANAMGLPKEELLFVGNSLEADIVGAVNSGWTCVWLNADDTPLSPGDTRPDYTIRQLSQLLTLEPVAEVLRGD